jgi:phenylpropionate dioxygenase-like ring-hydroxylating dioxygenase large terminal subunit
MLTREENALLTHVGPGTPMGEVFRRYWILAGITREIPEPDCPPVRIRLLGEDLLLFRDSKGSVGLVAEKCAHRRASLYFGRNEECGLRCVYHGWKYDVHGNIVDTPVEPANSMIRHHVKLTAYPTFEKNGMILTYMGPPEKQPLIPNYEWLTLPADHVDVEGKIFNENNWLQSLEGDCDSSHLHFLHRRAFQGSFDVPEGLVRELEFETETGPWWVKTTAIRHTAPDHNYLRTNMFMLPCIGGPPQPAVAGISDGFQAVHQVPADDTHTWRIDVWTRRSAPFEARRHAGDRLKDWPGAEGARAVDSEWKKTANKGNGYLINREKQRTSVWSGIPFGPHTQDAVMTESMGPIVDRENEHLGQGDSQIVAIRRLLLQVVRDVLAGKDPPGVAFRPEDNDLHLDIAHATLPPNAPWRDLKEMREHMICSGPPPEVAARPL